MQLKTVPYWRAASFLILFRNLCSQHATTSGVRSVDPQAIRWFPGHMRKGMNDISSKMARVDVVVEVHDARIPFSGRSEFIQQFGQIRPHILLLNKTDLAESIPSIDTFRKELMLHAKSMNQNLMGIYFTQLNSPEKQLMLLRRMMMSFSRMARQLTSSSLVTGEYAQEDATYSVQPTVHALAVGIPNTGKSTLINALRAVGRGGSGGAVRVGRSAGQTRKVTNPVIVSRGTPSQDWNDPFSPYNCRIVMLDTPGILEPRARSIPEQLSLCVCGSVDMDQVDTVLLVEYLLFWWNHRQRLEYVSVLGLPGPTSSVTELLARVCAQNTFFLPTTTTRPAHWQAQEVEECLHSNKVPLPDLRRAASHVLRLFDRGKFGRTTFLPSDEQAAAAYFVPVARH